MDQHQFSTLCRATCLDLGITDPDCLSNEGYCFVNETKVQLIFDEMLSNDRILCVCEIDEIRVDLKEKVFESLLMLNFLTGGKTTGVYAIDPLSQRASFVVTLINPDSLSASALADLLRCYSSRNSFLKKTLFKDGELHLSLDVENSEETDLVKNFRLV